MCQKSAKQSFVEVIFEPLSATMCILIHRAGIKCHQEHLRIYHNRRYALAKQYNSHSGMISGMGYSPHIQFTLDPCQSCLVEEGDEDDQQTFSLGHHRTFLLPPPAKQPFCIQGSLVNLGQIIHPNQAPSMTAGYAYISARIIFFYF